jgi:hypothetical protein
MLPFNYNFGLYRRNNFGQPCVWYAHPFDHASIEVFHGILGKTITREIITTNREPRAEITSRIKAKEKVGYKHLYDIKDNVESPVEGELLAYLDKYLPAYRTTADGSLLPMLAKVYNNVNNKLFNKVPYYIGQWKINGLRCFISAYVNSGNMFKPIGLKFQSREGTYWHSLSYLEDYLLSVLDNKLLERMVDENYILDGEVYLPGHTVNEIDHFVKDPKCIENKLLQYWCYDIAIEDTIQDERMNFLLSRQGNCVKTFTSKEAHLNNKERLIVLPNLDINDNDTAVRCRDIYIELGFEGLILRKPDAEYQYGKRNQSMIKFKAVTDGKFKIVDIYPEGVKRPDIPLLLCRNDVNDATFECHLSETLDFQREVLKNKEQFIGKTLFITYGERSGVNDVPFHIKQVHLL